MGRPRRAKMLYPHTKKVEPGMTKKECQMEAELFSELWKTMYSGRGRYAKEEADDV